MDAGWRRTVEILTETALCTQYLDTESSTVDAETLAKGVIKSVSGGSSIMTTIAEIVNPAFIRLKMA